MILSRTEETLLHAHLAGEFRSGRLQHGDPLETLFASLHERHRTRQWMGYVDAERTASVFEEVTLEETTETTGRTVKRRRRRVFTLRVVGGHG